MGAMLLLLLLAAAAALGTNAGGEDYSAGVGVRGYVAMGRESFPASSPASSNGRAGGEKTLHLSHPIPTEPWISRQKQDPQPQTYTQT
jgi:hypothetical protein